MNQNLAVRITYDAPCEGTDSEDTIHSLYRQLDAENKLKAIRFVEFLKASQHTPGP